MRKWFIIFFKIHFCLIILDIIWKWYNGKKTEENTVKWYPSRMGFLRLKVKQWIFTSLTLIENGDGLRQTGANIFKFITCIPFSYWPLDHGNGCDLKPRTPKNRLSFSLSCSRRLAPLALTSIKWCPKTRSILGMLSNCHRLRTSSNTRQTDLHPSPFAPSAMVFLFFIKRLGRLYIHILEYAVLGLLIRFCYRRWQSALFLAIFPLFSCLPNTRSLVALAAPFICHHNCIQAIFDILRKQKVHSNITPISLD